jgi:hypothetical protein
MDILISKKDGKNFIMARKVAIENIRFSLLADYDANTINEIKNSTNIMCE